MSQDRVPQYTRIIVIFNFLTLLILSLFFLDFWDIQVHPYFNTSFYLEGVMALAGLPLYFILLDQLLEPLDRDKKLPFLIAFIIFFILVGYGAGMHQAGNQIRNTHDTPIVFFYDELLSHWIAGIGSLGVTFVLAAAQLKTPLQNPIGKGKHLLIKLSGIFQGLVIGLAGLESHFGLASFLTTGSFIVLLVTRLRKRPSEHYPVTTYFLYLYAAGFILLTIWYIIHGSFVEPSASGFGKF